MEASTPTSITSTSSAIDNQGKKSESTYEDPYVNFLCAICGLSENCFHGKLSAGNGHYPREVYFMRDPFEPPSKKSRKRMLFDFLVLGSTCNLCSRPVCIHKSCSIYFGNHFCVDCISRERRRFPDEVIQMVTKAQETHIQFAENAQVGKDATD